MATFTDPGWPTLVNVLKRMKADGSVELDMAETMSNKRAILEDIPWIECNQGMSHLITSRTALPTPSWRSFNQGVDSHKSDSTQFEEACGMIEDRSDIDVKLAQVNGNSAAWRATEEKGFVEGFSQLVETAFLYENAATNPQRIHGLSARYPATSGYTASSYVTKGTNAGVNCRSLWLINWNPDRVFGLFPKGSMAGLQRSDKGEVYTRDANSKEILVYRTQFNWDLGLGVKDYRYSARHQWDPDDSVYASTGKGLILAMSQMIGTVFDMDETKARFYMDRVSFNLLQAQLLNSSVNLLEYIEMGKRRVPAFMNIPIRITDGLVAESAIS